MKFSAQYRYRSLTSRLTGLSLGVGMCLTLSACLGVSDQGVALGDSSGHGLGEEAPQSEAPKPKGSAGGVGNHESMPGGQVGTTGASNGGQSGSEDSSEDSSMGASSTGDQGSSGDTTGDSTSDSTTETTSESSDESTSDSTTDSTSDSTTDSTSESTTDSTSDSTSDTSDSSSSEPTTSDSSTSDSSTSDSSTSDSSTSDSSSSTSDGTTTQEPTRDCDDINWGVGGVVERGTAQGYVDSDGDDRLEVAQVDAGMCELYKSGRKCGLVLFGFHG